MHFSGETWHAQRGERMWNKGEDVGILAVVYESLKDKKETAWKVAIWVFIFSWFIRGNGAIFFFWGPFLKTACESVI